MGQALYVGSLVRSDVIQGEGPGAIQFFHAIVETHNDSRGADQDGYRAIRPKLLAAEAEIRNDGGSWVFNDYLIALDTDVDVNGISVVREEARLEGARDEANRWIELLLAQPYIRQFAEAMFRDAGPVTLTADRMAAVVAKLAEKMEGYWNIATKLAVGIPQNQPDPIV